ncbi:hypothetical protein EDD11_001323 [Mortierella claussenii]|nr:hypothetical protein EDD11_001323 [Mortierella claussenii]
MSIPSRSSSVSPFGESPSSPSPSLPDEGYDEQRIELPKWAHQWTDEQRAELAVQLLKSVSPSVFTRTYARLTPMFEYRDFLVLLPYELTVHLLSFLDEQSLASVAVVSKAWNRFASDNTVWKRLYFKRGWKVNQGMVDWYMRWADLEEQWELGPKGMHPRIHFESPSVVANGKRKMLEHDVKRLVHQHGEDYEMMQEEQELTGDYGRHHLHQFIEDDDGLAVQVHPDHFYCEQQFIQDSPTFGHTEDMDIVRSPEGDYEGISSPISIPVSSPITFDASPSPSPSPEHTSLFESSSSFLRSRGSSSMRTLSSSQRHGRFSLSNTTFMPSLHRTRLPMYTLGSSLMTPPSMLKKISNRSSPPSPLRIPGLQGVGSSSESSSTSRPSRFFGHQRSTSMDHTCLGPQPSSPTMPTSSALLSNFQGGPHSPLGTKSLWSVIRHGVMGVSGSAAWPSLHSHRNSESGEQDPQQHHSSHHISPSLPAWLMHLPSPLASSSRQHRNVAPQSMPSVSTVLPSTPTISNALDDKLETLLIPIPKRIDFQAANAPLPPEVLSADALHIHRHSVTKRPMINWRFLCQQRRLLEQNWNRGIHFAKELPGHTEGIYCIQFDDNKIISGSRDNTIKIWDLSTGACLRTYVGHSASVLCLQYDEDRIVSGSSDTTIIVWELETGKALQRLTGHVDSVLSLRFEKDIVVSCSKDRTVKIWKISTGEMIRTLVGHRAAVNAVQFSPESASPSPFAGSPRIVVSASGDKTIKIWSFETGECLRTLEGHARGIACIQFEGNLIVSGSSDRSIKIWDIARGECVKTLVGHDGLVRTLQFTGGRIISGGYDETLKIWDQESGKLLADMEGRHSHRVFKLQFNDSKIVSCSQDQKIIIWDFAVGVDTTFLT